MHTSKRGLIFAYLLEYLNDVKCDLFLGGSRGLNQIDLRLIKEMGFMENGFFVELGANNGVDQSNTYLLQKNYGWTGLLIEPSPVKYLECLVNRDFANVPAMRCAACVPFTFKERFVKV